ncbi:hypothetical protein BH09CHL1_BH09CHL1_08830 [soil metagenome]
MPSFSFRHTNVDVYRISVGESLVGSLLNGIRVRGEREPTRTDGFRSRMKVQESTPDLWFAPDEDLGVGDSF